MQVFRPYQTAADIAVRKASAINRAVLLRLPCGGGKMTLAAHWMRGCLQKNKRALFMVHRRELTGQARKRCKEHYVPHGIIEAGFRPDYSELIQIASVQSLTARMFPLDPETAATIEPPDFLIIDECHRANTKSYRRLIDAMPNAKILGLTATPRRMDGKSLGDIFDAMVEVIEVSDLIELGFLSDYIIYEPPTRVDAGGLKVNKDGEFDSEEAAARLDTDKLVGEVYENWKLHADGKRTIIFAASAKHGRHLCDVFRAHGEDFHYVDFRTPKADRDRITNDFENGRIKGIVNLSIYGEGFDVPAVECIVIDRFLHSLINWIQFTMRGMRPYPGKERCIILDHGFNARDRFGGPDFPHEWSLDGRKKRDEPFQPSLTTCPVCRAIVGSRTRICPECGHVFIAVAARTDIPDTVAGMLVEGNYKIKGSEVKEAKAAAILEKERRAQERAAAKLARDAEAAAKLRQLEMEKKFLQDAVAKMIQKGYNFMYPLARFRERFKSQENPTGFYPKSKHGIKVNWAKVWKETETPDGEIKGESVWKILGFEFEGVLYGERIKGTGAQWKTSEQK